MVESAGASETFLGLDLGTSSVKALLIDADQRVVAEASAGLAISRPHPLWSEQNPEDWIEGVEAAIAAVRRHAPDAFAGLAGIGLSGQMHGATFLDAQNRVLRPAILWNDGRSFAQCIELERRVPDFRHRAGNLAMPGFTAPKALWVAEHEPDVFAATARILLPKDFARLRLTGEAVSEMSDASGTLWLDIARRRWDDDLLAATGSSVAQMPRLVEGSEVSAFLSPEYAAAWGLGGRRIPIAGGAGDNAASAVGVGAVAAGEGFVSLGTSGVVFSVTDHYVSLPERTLHAFCHALPGRWHGMSVMLSAASALSWIAGVIGRGEEIGACVDAAEVFARSTSDVVAAPIFLPYLTGERTPYNDPAATGLFAGLTRRPWRGGARLRRAGGRRFRLRGRGRCPGRGGRAPDPALARRRRRPFRLLGADDLRRHRPDDRAGAWRGSGGGARRRAARDARGRRRRRKIDLRAAAGAARIPARRSPGGPSRPASATLSGAVRRGKGGAVKFSPRI